MKNKSIESGCKPSTIVKVFDNGDFETMTLDISKESEQIAREIYKQQNELVLTNLPKETLLKIKQQIDIELQRRYENNESN